MTVTAHCHKWRCQQLDLAFLRYRLDPDAPAMADDLTPKLKCSKCGGKAIGLTSLRSIRDENREDVGHGLRARSARPARRISSLSFAIWA